MGVDRFVLGPAELVSVRFALAPGIEVVRIVRRLVHRRDVPLQRALLAGIARDVPSDTIATLGTLIPPRGYVPDFLIQPGAETPLQVLAGIRETPAEVVATELGRLRTEARRGVPPVWADPERCREEVAGAWEDLWRHGLEPRWAWLERVLRADIADRSRQLAAHGLAAVIIDLSPRLAWDGEVLTRSDSPWCLDVDCTGRGLRLVPSVMSWPRGAVSTDEPWPPTIYYPARHATALPQPHDDPLVPLLGRTRARILAHLRLPARTSDVARALDISPATASHHLTILREAGLVTTAREGAEAWHARTTAVDVLGW